MRCAQELREALRESIDAFLHVRCVCLYCASWLGTMGVCASSRASAWEFGVLVC